MGTSPSSQNYADNTYQQEVSTEHATDNIYSCDAIQLDLYKTFSNHPAENADNDETALHQPKKMKFSNNPGIFYRLSVADLVFEKIPPKPRRTNVDWRLFLLRVPKFIVETFNMGDVDNMSKIINSVATKNCFLVTPQMPQGKIGREFVLQMFVDAISMYPDGTIIIRPPKLIDGCIIFKYLFVGTKVLDQGSDFCLCKCAESTQNHSSESHSEKSEETMTFENSTPSRGCKVTDQLMNWLKRDSYLFSLY